MPQSIPITPALPAIHVPVVFGGEVVLRGWFYSGHDGSIVDAATTSWPVDAPGGASVHAGGLFDLAAGGFDLVAADPVDHVVRLVATDAGAPACNAWGVRAPCLILRTTHLAHTRLLTGAEWSRSLRGEMHAELSPLALIPETHSASGQASAAPITGLGVALLAALGTALVLIGYRRWRRSDRQRLTQVLSKLGRTARSADPVLYQVLTPALQSTSRALRERRLDPASAPAGRLAAALQHLDGQLREQAARRQQQAQRDTAQALARELELALEAAAEASQSAQSA